jgi:hypothetical protein
MNSGSIKDLIALIRSVSLAAALPHTIRSARGNAEDFARTYERVVKPILEDTVRDQPVRYQIHDALLAVSTKLSFLIAGYAAMASAQFHIELAVLGSSLARVYDDLFDEVGGPGLDDRLAELFHGGEFAPVNDVELLFLHLYREADARLGRSADDPVYSSLIGLHRYQIMSRQQKDPLISPEMLTEVTLGKGGHGLAVLFAMMRPSMGAAEHRLIMELGGTLQLLDDYQDFELDRRNGVYTAATCHRLDLSHITSRLSQLRLALVDFYGRRQARRFLAVVYATLWISFLRRRWPRLGTRVPPPRRRHHEASPLSVLVTPGDNVVQKAAQRRPAQRT